MTFLKILKKWTYVKDLIFFIWDNQADALTCSKEKRKHTHFCWIANRCRTVFPQWRKESMELLMENIVCLFISYNFQRNIKFLKNNQQGLNLSD